jgi:preprotein translocase subunit SecE
MSNIISYLESAYDELVHKVSWPTWKELQETTSIVLITLALITTIVFVMDGAAELLFSKAIYKIFK